MIPRGSDQTTSLSLMVLIALQTFCALVFVADIVWDVAADGFGFSDIHQMIEVAAVLSLLAAIVVEARILMRLLRRQARLEKSLGEARAAVQEVIESYFEAWRLSPSERDVANFLVKGMTIAETARLRGCAEGTVKAHLNAIYRKSETRDRAELMAFLIDAMMGAEMETAAEAEARPAAGQVARPSPG